MELKTQNEIMKLNSKQLIGYCFQLCDAVKRDAERILKHKKEQKGLFKKKEQKELKLELEQSKDLIIYFDYFMKEKYVVLLSPKFINFEKSVELALQVNPKIVKALLYPHLKIFIKKRDKRLDEIDEELRREHRE